MKTASSHTCLGPLETSLSAVGKLLMLVGATGLICLPVKAAITVDGMLDAGYGSALAVQSVQTAFGDSTYNGTPNGPDADGSELDAAYGTVQGGYFYLFLAGNFQNNGNHVNVFIADGRAGQNTLAAPTGNTLGPAMNGSVFSSGFDATLALDLNDYQGTAYVEEYSLVGTPSGGYAGSFALSSGIGTGSPGGSIMYGLNNSNTGGVVGGTGAADTGAASAVTTGLEIQIPLSMLGNPSGNIQVVADINGGGDGYLSNQFLPGLPSGTDNVGGGGTYSGSGSGQFDFGLTPGQYLSVPVPEPSSLAFAGLGSLLAWAASRKRRSV